MGTVEYDFKKREGRNGGSSDQKEKDCVSEGELNTLRPQLSHI